MLTSSSIALKPGGRTVLGMSRLVAFLRSLGAEGAARNARVLLDERSREGLAVEALAATMARAPVGPRVTAAA